MSSSSRLAPSPAGRGSSVIPISGARGGRGGPGSRGGPRRLVDAVADHGAVAGVDQQREDRVHDVVVGRTSTACQVSPPLAGGALDLQERALLSVRLAGVDDEIIGENELGQW